MCRFVSYWHDADYLSMQDARSPAAMLLTYSFRIIIVLAPEATDLLLFYPSSFITLHVFLV